MLFRLARRFSITSTKFFLLLTGASAIFVYLVSPLRDPAYQPMGANGGSRLWWLEGVPEDLWTLAALILAGLLAINITLDLWQWCKSQNFLAVYRHPRGMALRHFLIVGMHYGIGIGMWLILSYTFVFYLLDQWLID